MYTCKERTMHKYYGCIVVLCVIFCSECTYVQKKERCTKYENTMGALWFCVWFFAQNVHLYSWKNGTQNTVGALYFCVWILALYVHMYNRKNHAQNTMGALWYVGEHVCTHSCPIKPSVHCGFMVYMCVLLFLHLTIGALWFDCEHVCTH